MTMAKNFSLYRPSAKYAYSLFNLSHFVGLVEKVFSYLIQLHEVWRLWQDVWSKIPFARFIDNIRNINISLIFNRKKVIMWVFILYSFGGWDFYLLRLFNVEPHQLFMLRDELKKSMICHIVGGGGGGWSALTKCPLGKKARNGKQ